MGEKERVRKKIQSGGSENGGGVCGGGRGVEKICWTTK